MLLSITFHIKEFKEAFFDMHSNKTPGSDGLNPRFYERIWSLCGVETFNVGVAWLEG
jgi:hypothetical protein